MILDAIVQAVVTFLTGVMGLFPSYSLPSSVANFGSTLGGAIASLNGVVPMFTIGACVSAVIGVRVLGYLWGIVVWIYDKFPFKAT